MKIASHSEIKELLRIDEHAGELALHARSDRMIQAIHFVICVQIITLTIVCQAIYGVEILLLYQVFGLYAEKF